MKRAQPASNRHPHPGLFAISFIDDRLPIPIELAFLTNTNFPICPSSLSQMPSPIPVPTGMREKTGRSVRIQRASRSPACAHCRSHKGSAPEVRRPAPVGQARAGRLPARVPEGKGESTSQDACKLTGTPGTDWELSSVEVKGAVCPLVAAKQNWQPLVKPVQHFNCPGRSQSQA